ncbi:MAG: hypothetical protein ACLU3N_10805 [Lachnospiraceae bacterium]
MLKLFHSLDLKLNLPDCTVWKCISGICIPCHSFPVSPRAVSWNDASPEHWFHISPSVSGFIMNLACYAMGWILGRQFIAYSILSSASFSLSYRICEQFPPYGRSLPICRLPHPCSAQSSSASVPGSACGSAVPGGDDALALAFPLTHIKIQWIYLLSILLYWCFH